jgi:peptidoglycan/xylan/chitin deacetylase (PgdA/CDA1 family)
VITRARVAAVRTNIERRALALREHHLGGHITGHGRVLAYHSVGTPAWGVNDVHPARFAAQMHHALDLGFGFVPADQIARGEGRAYDLALTFDDGLASVLNAEPVLRSLGIPWTVFVVTDWVEGRHPFGPDVAFLGWQDIAVLHARGVSIGSHSVTHPNFARLDAAQAIDELVCSRATLAEHLGSPPSAFAIPFGQSHDWSDLAQADARAAGYRTIYAQSERRCPALAGTTPRTFITRFDDEGVFRAALWGAFDGWEEWF